MVWWLLPNMKDDLEFISNLQECWANNVCAVIVIHIVELFQEELGLISEGSNEYFAKVI